MIEYGFGERIDSQYMATENLFVAPPPPILVPYPSERDAQPHIGHKYHLCNLADSGIISLEEMKALIRDTRFICKKCGRVAAKAENLCEPDPF